MSISTSPTPSLQFALSHHLITHLFIYLVCSVYYMSPQLNIPWFDAGWILPPGAVSGRPICQNSERWPQSTSWTGGAGQRAQFVSTESLDIKHWQSYTLLTTREKHQSARVQQDEAVRCWTMTHYWHRTDRTSVVAGHWHQQSSAVIQAYTNSSSRIYFWHCRCLYICSQAPLVGSVLVTRIFELYIVIFFGLNFTCIIFKVSL